MHLYDLGLTIVEEGLTGLISCRMIRSVLLDTDKNGDWLALPVTATKFRGNESDVALRWASPHKISIPKADLLPKPYGTSYRWYTERLNPKVATPLVADTATLFWGLLWRYMCRQRKELTLEVALTALHGIGGKSAEEKVMWLTGEYWGPHGQYLRQEYMNQPAC